MTRKRNQPIARRRPGRPPYSEDERWQRAQTARRTVNEELTAMQGSGLIRSPGKAIDRAARRLGISMKTVERLLAVAPAVDPRDEQPPRCTWDEWKQAEYDDWQADQD